MPLLINVRAVEDTPLPSRATGAQVTSAQLDTAFRTAERGVFTMPDGRSYSRTPQNGGWVGVMAVSRDSVGNADVTRTWELTDAQMAASGLNSIAAINTFVDRLAQDTGVTLDAYATRTGIRSPGLWTVTTATRTTLLPGTVLNGPGPRASSNLGWWMLLAAVVGTGALIYSEAD